MDTYWLKQLNKECGKGVYGKQGMTDVPLSS